MRPWLFEEFGSEIRRADLVGDVRLQRDLEVFAGLLAVLQRDECDDRLHRDLRRGRGIVVGADRARLGV